MKQQANNLGKLMRQIRLCITPNEHEQILDWKKKGEMDKISHPMVKNCLHQKGETNDSYQLDKINDKERSVLHKIEPYNKQDGNSVIRMHYSNQHLSSYWKKEKFK